MQTALVATGLIPRRDEDQAGVSVAMARAGGPFRRAGTPVTSHETVFEASYRATLTPWLTVQPDMQFVFHPGFDPTLKNAVVVGIRFEVSPLAFFK